MSGSFGPMKLDFSSFYKFVASVGLVLIASSAVLPWFVMRAAVPDAQTGTSAAKVAAIAINERVKQYLFVVQIYPWISLVLFFLGCVLTGYGLIAWRDRQKKQDADEDETYRQHRELGHTTQASEDEKEKKLNREASEQEDPIEGSVVKETDGSSANATRPTQSKEITSSGTGTFQTRRKFIHNAEMQVGKLLSQAFLDSHRIEAGVRVGSNSSFLDFVARAIDPSHWASFAIEIKYIQSASLTMRLRETMLTVAIAARDVPTGQIQVQRVGRPPMASSVSLCLVIVADEELVSHQPEHRSLQTNIGSLLESTRQLVSVVNSVFSRQVGVIVVPEKKFKNISSDWLRESVLDTMQRPDIPVVWDE